MPVDWVVVGLDNGGTTNNGTILDSGGQFLLDEMAEVPSKVREGPDKAIQSLVDAVEQVLGLTGVPITSVRAVGLDSPGPASGRRRHLVQGRDELRARRLARLRHPGSAGRAPGAPGDLQQRRELGRAVRPSRAVRRGVRAAQLGGRDRGYRARRRDRGEAGQVVKGAAGMAGELGHVPIPLDDLLAGGQPMPACNCGQSGDAESVASLTGIQNNLLPYWLTRYPDHELAGLPIGQAAKLIRKYAENGDEMALAIFRQQAIALGRLFTIAANFLDPDAYFLGGGVVEAAPHFRDWFFAEVRANTTLREEQARAAEIDLVPDLDMAGARGSAFAARDWLIRQRLEVMRRLIREPVLSLGRRDDDDHGEAHRLLALVAVAVRAAGREPGALARADRVRLGRHRQRQGA